MKNILNETDLENISGGRLSIGGERSPQTDFVGPDTPQPDDGDMHQN